MKKIKVLDEKILEKLILSLRSGRADALIPPSYLCKKCDNWQKIDSAPLYFFRNWDEERLPNEGGASFLFHDGTNLNLVSIMDDSDVFSDAGPSNDKTWIKGDVLELFIMPANGKRYYEIHLAPNLATLQLSIPSIDEFRAGKLKFEELFFDSEAEFGAGKISCDNFNGWGGLISIPSAKIGLDITPASTAKFAVGRYNYSRGKEKPECSFSAPLTKFQFHVPEEWQTLIFQ